MLLILVLSRTLLVFVVVVLLALTAPSDDLSFPVVLAPFSAISSVIATAMMSIIPTIGTVATFPTSFPATLFSDIIVRSSWILLHRQSWFNNRLLLIWEGDWCAWDEVIEGGEFAFKFETLLQHAVVGAVTDPIKIDVIVVTTPRRQHLILLDNTVVICFGGHYLRRKDHARATTGNNRWMMMLSCCWRSCNTLGEICGLHYCTVMGLLLRLAAKVDAIVENKWLVIVIRCRLHEIGLLL